MTKKEIIKKIINCYNTIIKNNYFQISWRQASLPALATEFGENSYKYRELLELIQIYENENNNALLEVQKCIDLL